MFGWLSVNMSSSSQSESEKESMSMLLVFGPEMIQSSEKDWQELPYTSSFTTATVIPTGSLPIARQKRLTWTVGIMN